MSYILDMLSGRIKLISKRNNLEKEIKIMPIFCILAIFVFGIPLLKEQIENQNYREQCRRRGDKTYWSVDGLRYTDTDKKVYK